MSLNTINGRLSLPWVAVTANERKKNFTYQR
jgi:hypothetical protein